ncbi:hypothetical protein A3A38_00305 [Candidatus Kaiserbacteria bacterium RIFCSPLOWO2_01_FULL_53_17]|uniref:Uncharacterized protein n=1 Tax=Candidatus Kaiserbacteria bacterium RIFCSPLOWO2_01_FULL_53_17 TaxID=1798511 RepID=A0A1F6EG97_9BACT|nr:MAG: hypothetical protein A3A38_00305 [Candidatus Kaiserbacteria bacterium RIFCSPLOWO2_01_FULL_53_17]
MNAVDVRGGSTRFVTDLAENLRVAGHTVEILVRNGRVLSFLREVHAHARVCDIVQAIDVKPLGIIAYLATRFTKAKYVIVGQGSYAVAPLDNPKTSLIARHVYRAAGAVVAISSFIKREIDGRMKGARVVVINHGVDLAKFHGALAAPKGGVPYVLGVGSIKHRKGYDTALRAFIRAKKDIPELRYCIVGAHIDEPKYVQKLMETVRESGVADSVDFVKDISDERLRKLYQNASLFMLTSVNEGGHFEGFGLVFLEAAAYGLASIGTKGNGIEDAIIDGKTGILVPQYDVEATAAAIIRLMRDDELRKRLGAGARRHAEARTWQIVVREYEELYDSIIAN